MNISDLVSFLTWGMTQHSPKQMGTFTLISVGTKIIPKDQLEDHCYLCVKFFWDGFYNYFFEAIQQVENCFL